MKHASENELVERYYGEPGAEAVEAHLAECAECRESFAALAAVLNAVEEPPLAEPREGFEGRLWANIEPRLARAPGRRWWEGFSTFNWRVAAAMAAMLVVGFFAGRFAPSPSGNAAGSGPGKERVRLVELSNHLERAEFLLLDIVNTDAAPETDIGHTQAWARTLLDNNRLLRQAAADDGDLMAAALLEDLERVLLEVVHEPSRLDASGMDALRERVESGETLFRVRLLGRQLRTPEGWQRELARAGRS